MLSVKMSYHRHSMKVHTPGNGLLVYNKIWILCDTFFQSRLIYLSSVFVVERFFIHQMEIMNLS